MKTDIILCGVGGQGILTIATVIGAAATATGINLKQAEVHGMSQRGGDVQSNLRLSTEAVWSDLIPLGGADLIISMEPMEALRYLPWLRQGGHIITASTPLVNIPDYPDHQAVRDELLALGNVELIDIESLAQQHGIPRSANIILLGAAAHHLDILGTEALREALGTIFAAKGEAVVEANRKAFELGYKQPTI